MGVGERKGDFLETECSAVARERHLVAVFLPDGELPEPQLQSSIVKNFASPNEAMHSSIRGRGRDSLMERVLNRR